MKIKPKKEKDENCDWWKILGYLLFKLQNKLPWVDNCICFTVLRKTFREKHHKKNLNCASGTTNYITAWISQ